MQDNVKKDKEFHKLREKVIRIEERNRILEEENNLFKMINESGRDLITIHNEKGRILYASPSSFPILGYRPEEMTGLGFAELGFDAAKVEFFESAIRDVYTSLEPSELEFELETKVGSRYLNWKLVPEFGTDGQINTVLGILRDQTEYQNNLREQAKATEILSATERLSRSGSFIFNLRSGEVYWSKGLYELIDRLPSDGPITDKELKRLMSERDFVKFNNLLLKARKSMYSIKGDFKIVLKRHPPMFLEIELRRDPFYTHTEPKIIGIVRDRTDLQRIQMSLSSAEEKFRHIFENLPDGIMVSAYNNGKIVDFNVAFQRLTKFTAADIRDKTSVDIGIFPDFGVRDKFFLDLQEEKPILNKELALTTKYGESVDVLVSSTSISIEGENYLLSIIRDITKLKGVERALNDSHQRLLISEEKFTAFLNHSPDGIMITDEGGRIQDWNTSMEKLTGIPGSRAVGSDLMNILEKIHTFNIGSVPDFDLLRKKLEEFFKTGAPELITMKENREVMLPGIGKLYIEIFTFPITTEKGYRIGQISRDISEQKEFEHNVLLYRDIFINNEDGIAIMNLKGRYTEINRAHKEILGFPAEELNGKTPAVFLGERLFDEIFRVYDYQGAFEGELNASRSNGKKIFIDFILFPVMSDNLPVCIVSVVRDISGRKNTERELIEARRAAEEADSLKTAFLSNMSHEIRTPMNSILGFSGLLENTKLDEDKRKKYIGYINKNGDNLLHLIEDIIDISKIESNQIKIEKAPCDIHELLEDLFTSMARVLEKEEKKSVQLTKKFPDEALWAHTDGFRLRQIFINLIHNAIKFTDNGFVEIGYHSGNEKEILFHVKDTGIGIPPELMDSIFERFRKLENEKKKLYGGAGLGLAITKQLVNLMGGRIWVESDVGKGTTFYFTTPLVRSYIEEVLEGTERRKEIRSKWTGKKILIVEDDQYSFELIGEFLSGTEAEFIHVTDGKEAVKIITGRSDIDLVIMDIQIPGMSGYEATRLIKTMNSAIPVIAQTAFAMEEDKKMAFQAGCDEFLTKPLNRQVFLEVLGNFLN